jgi:hypothetical protein
MTDIQRTVEPYDDRFLPMFNCPKRRQRRFCTVMEMVPDTIRQRCSTCGNTLRLITSMLEPRSGKTFHMLLCDCGEKSWTADNANSRERYVAPPNR